MQFIKEILSSDSGQGSFSRISGAIIILALIIWASILVLTTKAIHDVPACWLALVLGLYGINKIADGATAIAATIKNPLGTNGQANVEQPANPAS